MTSLRNKLWFGFGSLLSILLCVSGLSLAVFNNYSHALERLFRENYNSALYSSEMRESLDRLNVYALRMISNEQSAASNDAATQVAHFQANLDSQYRNIVLPGESEATARIAELWSQYQDVYHRFADADPKHRLELYQGELLPAYEELKRATVTISDMNMSNMVSADGRVKQTLISVRNAMCILIAAGVALASVIVLTATSIILRPVEDLIESARQIESGNLELQAPSTTCKEMKPLADAFNSMIDKLRELKQIDHDRLVRTQLSTHLAISSLPDPIFVLNSELVVDISNDAARTLFFVKPGQAMASLKLKWLPALYDQATRQKRATVPDGYRSAVQLFVDGAEHFFLPKAVPMLSPDERILGVTVILLDVTRLRHADEAKSNLVSTVSHELRTPLTSQRLLLDLLLSSTQSQLSATQKRLLEVAKADGDRLYHTIEDLLSISRMESGRAQFQFRSMSPADLVKASVVPLKHLFDEKNIKLTTAIDPDLPCIRVDPSAIHSALSNLLSNALKFTPSGGSTSLQIAKAHPFVHFSVGDTGPGIPEQFRGRIFEKFFRVPTTTGPNGAGLGLAITKQIVEAHDGTIRFECPPAGGTIFHFSLPIDTYNAA